MRYFLLLVVFISEQNFGQIPAGFLPLFNGKDLTGWHVSRTSHQGTTPDFYVDGSSIAVKQNPYGQGGVLLTDQKFSDFELYVEVQLDSFCNSGIFIRSTESGQAYQIELANPGGTGSLYGEALKISKSAEAKDVAKIWKPNDWNTVRVKMTGEIPTVAVWINDIFMYEITQPQNDFTAGAISGMIGLQTHWTALYQPTPGGFNMPGAWRPGARVQFRNIGIREIR